MARDFGIDIGSSNTRIYMMNGGLVLSEPTVIALDNYTDEILAVGKEALQMLGKTPETVSAVLPVSGGVAVNVDKLGILLSIYLDRVCPGLLRPRVTVSVPYNTSEVERRGIVSALHSAKAKNIHIIEEPIAGMIGLGYDIFEANGRMIVDIGAGKTSVSVISLGGIVANTTTDASGGKMIRDTISFVRKKYGVLIGEKSAFGLIVDLASTMEKPFEFVSVNGRNSSDGLPSTVDVSNDDMWDAIQDTVNDIVDSVRITLEKVSPELVSDISENGIVCVGEGSRLNGLPEYIEYMTGVRCELAVDPVNAVASGVALAMEQKDMYDRGIIIPGAK